MIRLLTVAVTLVVPTALLAQETNRASGACTPGGRAVAAFAARVHGWSERRPTASIRGSIGRGVVWDVVDNPECCPRPRRTRRRGGATVGFGLGCSTHSEARTALVGVVGSRRWALTAAPPPIEMVVDGESLVAEPWQAAAWSAFLRASRAIPGTPEEARTVAVAVYESLRPGLGVVRDEAAVERAREQAGAAGRDLASARQQARRLGLGPIDAPVMATDAGFEVSLWSSRSVRAESRFGRESGPGADSTEDLRRSVLAIGRDGTVTLREERAVRGNLTRGRL